MKIKKLQKHLNKILKEHKTTIYIYPKSSFAKSDDYDVFRKDEVGNYTKTGHNPVGLKVYVRDASPQGLIVRELGLQLNKVKELWIENKYIDLVKNAEKIEIDSEEYSIWSKAVGDKLQLYPRKGTNMTEILIFKK